MQSYNAPVERAMKKFFDSLSEKDRRGYAAVEVAKLGHGGVEYIAGIGEQLPLASQSFDFLSMGYALRHLSDLSVTFREFRRVLKYGGKICILEITRPKSKLAFHLMRSYMRFVVPWITRLTASRAASPLLWQYYWDTIEACIPPNQVLEALSTAGFVDIAHHSELGVFSEYTARKP